MSTLQLYPLRFTPQLKQKVWGGSGLHNVLGKEAVPDAGESWEISAVDGSVSVVANGPLSGTDLQELVRKYKDELLGTRVQSKYGDAFPLLFKFIDAREDLSVQLHPSDELARVRHDSFGKNEMWYILHAEPGARLIIGFDQQTDKKGYSDALKKGHLVDLLHEVPVKAGDTFYIRTGTVHAIGGGVLLAEIQQTSDVTYRIYDWDRPDKNGNFRELHIDLAMDAIDFDAPDARLTYQDKKNSGIELAQTPYFLTLKWNLDRSFTLHLAERDSFSVLMCIGGSAVLTAVDTRLEVSTGDSILVPACLEHIYIETVNCTFLDVSMPRSL